MQSLPLSDPERGLFLQLNTIWHTHFTNGSSGGRQAGEQQKQDWQGKEGEQHVFGMRSC
jgi:hypothetical protein